MRYMPKDILDYIYENDLDSDFMVSVMNHKGGYSIAEITDAKYREREDGIHLIAPSYKINVLIEDEDILKAIAFGMYVSAFISRKQDDYQVHFLVHQYLAGMKQNFEEDILNEVVRYMILKTVKALRLDTPAKVDEYIGRK